ncbi:MAG: cytidine deaminase [Actinomycetota bacterium]|nr:cytidine deaminase [Actinomycetota bacterium]
MTTPEELLERAADVATRAYVPYSSFRVGAAAVDSDGNVHTGANVENAAYPATICAEANAVTTAAALGVRKIDAIAVVHLDGDLGDLCTPCGNCRQILKEFGVETVIMRNPDGSPHTVTLEQLLPMAFGPEAFDAER